MNRSFAINLYVRRLLVFVVVIAETASIVHAQSIFSNPITDSNPSASNPYTNGQIVDSNITVSGIGRGSGISANSGSNRYNATSWTLGSSLDADDYFSWTLTPNAGFEIDFLSFEYTGQRSPTGPSSFVYRSSVDGFTSDIGSPTATGTTISLSGAEFQNISTAIEFRIYGFGGTNAAGTFSINDFAFNGTVSAMAMLGTFWDANGATAGVGGTGTWSATSNTWATTAAGTTVGMNDVTKTLIFDGTAGMVNVSGTVTPQAGLQFITDGYSLNGGTIELAGASAAANTITTSPGVSASISSQLTGTNGLTKSGSGTLVLTGTNTYSGATNISTGTLALSGSGSINASSSIAVAAGARLLVDTTTNIAPDTTVSGTLSGVNGTIRDLGFDGNLTIHQNATVSLDVLGTPESPLSDRLNVSGVLDFETGGGMINIDLTGLTTTPTTAFEVAVVTTSGNIRIDGSSFLTETDVTEFFSVTSSSFTISSYSVSINGTSLNLFFMTVVPEPGTILLICAGAAGLVQTVRRRRKTIPFCAA